MDHHYQISHEELLLVAGLLRLPPPLALGPWPAAGYSRAALGMALGTAAGSLAARGLLSDPGAGGGPPSPAPGLAEAMRLLCAERCLVLASSHGDRHAVGQIGLGTDGQALLLASPRPGAYTLRSASGQAALVGHIIALLPQTAGEPGPSLIVPGAALLAALDAAPAGPGAVAAQLAAAGVPASAAAAFADRLGSSPARHALVALRDAADRPERRGLLIIGGASGSWIADDEAAAAAPLRPICPADMRAAVADIVAWAVA
jgi:hypothetical protein